MQASYHFLARNKTVYDVMLSQASAGTLPGKVTLLTEDEIDLDEDQHTVTFECRQCMSETTIQLKEETVEETTKADDVIQYLSQCDSCSLYYRLDVPRS